MGQAQVTFRWIESHPPRFSTAILNGSWYLPSKPAGLAFSFLTEPFSNDVDETLGPRCFLWRARFHFSSCFHPTFPDRLTDILAQSIQRQSLDKESQWWWQFCRHIVNGGDGKSQSQLSQSSPLHFDDSLVANSLPALLTFPNFTMWFPPSREKWGHMTQHIPSTHIHKYQTKILCIFVLCTYVLLLQHLHNHRYGSVWPSFSGFCASQSCMKDRNSTDAAFFFQLHYAGKGFPDYISVPCEGTWSSWAQPRNRWQPYAWLCIV